MEITNVESKFEEIGLDLSPAFFKSMLEGRSTFHLNALGF